MKITRQHIEGFAVGIALIAAIPFLAFAARTATPLVTSLFPSNLVYVNMAPPVVSLPTAPGSGSLTAGGTIYFLVTALDGQGETTGGNYVGTTTIASSALQLTWPAVNGATGYRVYYSTSTPAVGPQFLQYDAATSTGSVPNLYFTMTATSSPTAYVATQPTSNTAYGVKLNSTGSSYIVGGSLGISTSSPAMALDVASGTMRAYSVSTSSCAAVNDGAIFYNAKDFHLYVCEQTVWQILK